MNLHPILAAWIIAAFIRVCLGSATVAGLTAAGMIAPMIVGYNHQSQPDRVGHRCRQSDVFSCERFRILVI